MAGVLSRRLGKRSLLGARVLGPPGATPCLESQAEPPEGAPRTKDPSCQGPYRETLQTSGPAVLPPAALQPEQKVWPGPPGLREQHSWAEELVTEGLPEQRPQEHCHAQEVLAAEALAPPQPGPQTPIYRPVSRNIDVPKRKSDSVEMDEMMAAMVLTSLSCSPVLQSPPGTEASSLVSRAACDVWKESGDVSDSGSSTTSGHWSGSSGLSTPSPPHPQASPKYLGDALGSPQTDAGFETDPDAFLLDEPAPRKRKNSVKVMYKCLWPGCGKVLRSIVGIKRHVRTLHLGDTVGSDQFKREEDFYYTEVQAKEGASEPMPTPGVASPPVALFPPPMPPVPPMRSEHGRLESYLPSRALSKSAPESFWHIQADHAYQAVPSFQMPVSPHIYTSISWAAPSTTASLSPVRSRSLSLSEPPPPPPTVKSHLIVTSPPRTQSSVRKGRGEAKKCRKVYGVEHRAQWCTACRWKKACQRFLD